MLIFLWN